MATSRDLDIVLAQKIRTRCGIALTETQTRTLRRAEIALRRWGEGKCGYRGEHISWAIERDEDTDIPYRVTHSHKGNSHRVKIQDKERGALRRIKAICDEAGLLHYHQTDPRGASLYVGTAAILGDSDIEQVYSSRFVCCAGGS